MELSFPRTFAPGSESPIGGTFAPWNFRSMELSLPGTFVPWNFRSRDLYLQSPRLHCSIADTSGYKVIEALSKI